MITKIDEDKVIELLCNRKLKVIDTSVQYLNCDTIDDKYEPIQSKERTNKITLLTRIVLHSNNNSDLFHIRMNKTRDIANKTFEYYMWCLDKGEKRLLAGYNQDSFKSIYKKLHDKYWVTRFEESAIKKFIFESMRNNKDEKVVKAMVGDIKQLFRGNFVEEIYKECIVESVLLN